jgi:hypothetical protein
VVLKRKSDARMGEEASRECLGGWHHGRLIGGGVDGDGQARGLDART